MSLIVLLARLLLVLIFVVAGLAKLADLQGSQQALRDFGVPTVLARPVGLLLPLAELAVAVALVPPLTAWWAALGALTLLLLFVGGIGYNLARGRQPDCHCFGQLHSAPAGWPTLIRNLLLAAVAGVVVAYGRSIPGPGVLDWLAPLSVSQRLEVLGGVLLLALLLGEGWLLVQTMSQHGRVLLRLEALEGRLAAAGTAGTVAPTETRAAPGAGLPVGVPAPGFALSTLGGETMTLHALRGLGKPVLLLFSDPGCGSCNALVPEVGRWRREHASTLLVVLISRRTSQADRSNVSASGLTQMLLQHDREVAQAYQVTATPSAVLVRPDGTIGSPLTQGVEAIRDLVASAVGVPPLPSLPTSASLDGNGHGHGALPLVKQPGSAVASKVGKPAPAFSLPDLSGNMVALSDFRGSPTLLLFWNPGCGFCQRMLSDLQTWEANPPKGAPKLLLLATGSAEANAALGLRSPLLLDANMSVGKTFGATGTPNAVLVDAEGHFASDVAAGAPAVLALAGVQTPALDQGRVAAQRVPATPQIGEPAPAFSLPDLSGQIVHLSDFRGHTTLLLFWRPSCGFCQRMLADLKDWETNPPKGAPSLLVVSTDSVESNQAMGLRSPVLLDQDGMRVGRLFGASGTPMAVLVDEQGKIASELAAGAPAVLALAEQASRVHA